MVRMGCSRSVEGIWVQPLRNCFVQKIAFLNVSRLSIEHILRVFGRVDKAVRLAKQRFGWVLAQR